MVLVSTMLESQSPYGTGSEGFPFFGSLLDVQTDGSAQVYMRNRYYDPSTGRFTQEDPIGLAGGLNLYGYANGDPVNFSDPFGLLAWPVWVVRGALWVGARFGIGLGTAAAVDRVVRAAGPSIRRAMTLGNEARLTQSQQIQAVTRVLQNDARGHGGIIRAANGARIILPVQQGPNQPIVHVAADGVAQMGSATVRFIVEGSRLVPQVTDIMVP